MHTISTLHAASQVIIRLFIIVILCCSMPALQAAEDSSTHERLLGELRVASQSLDRVQAYNEYLQELIANQQAARAELEQRLENYRLTRPEVVPLMTRMIDSLRDFVELDLPFELDIRRERVQRLQDNMGKPEMAIADKFREILEAYQAELDYGRDIDATVGWIEVNGPRREVSFLRIGRLVLVYQTHDGTETGFFNPLTRTWEPLADQYRRFVADGLRIAKKQAAPVLLKLPVPAPVVTGAAD